MINTLNSLLTQLFCANDKKKSQRFPPAFLGYKDTLQLDILMNGIPFVHKDMNLEFVPFEIITRANEEESFRHVDVGNLQGLSDNKGALFQVASNFNVIESPSETVSPLMDNFTQSYYRDKTQGPSASISTGAAAIARVYCPFLDLSTDLNTWNQTKAKQVNLLEHLKEHFPLKNGYITFNGTEPKFPKLYTKEYYKLLLMSKTCYHKDCQVITGYRDHQGYEKVKDPAQLVDQCICGAINISQGSSGTYNATTLDIQTKCLFALELAYNGTYLEAIQNKKRKIFLTMLGGGAFGNNKDWILSSIINAHKKWGYKDYSCLEKVSLVLSSNTHQILPTLKESLEKEQIPYSIVLPGNNVQIQ